MANVSDTFKTGTMLKAGGPLSTIDVDEAVQQAQAEGALQGAQVNLLAKPANTRGAPFAHERKPS